MASGSPDRSARFGVNADGAYGWEPLLDRDEEANCFSSALSIVAVFLESSTSTSFTRRVVPAGGDFRPDPVRMILRWCVFQTGRMYAAQLPRSLPSTISIPCIAAWPPPQYSEQMIGYWPAESKRKVASAT